MLKQIANVIVRSKIRNQAVPVLLLAAGVLATGCDDISYLLDTSHSLCEGWSGSAFCLSGGCGTFTEISVYPNASSCEAAASAANGGGGGGGGGDTGGGGGDPDCLNYSDNTSYFGDVQLDTLCQAAGYYRTCGPPAGVTESCANLDELLDCCWDGGGYCPHC